jgi:hypothetical protein
MLSKTLTYGAVFACGVLALASLSVLADDKKNDKEKAALSGSWVKKEGELKIVFTDKDTMKIVPHGDEEVIVILCTYTVEKGEIKAKVSGSEGKEEARKKVEEKLPVGTKFRFSWQVKDDAAKLDDLKGEDVELLKAHLEGEYERKK